MTDSSANDKPLCRHHCQLSHNFLGAHTPHPALCGKNSVSPSLVTLSTSFTLSFSQFVLMGFVIEPYVHTWTSVFTILADVFIGSRERPPALYNPVDSSVSSAGFDLDGWGLIPDCGRGFSLRHYCVQTGAHPTFYPTYGTEPYLYPYLHGMVLRRRGSIYADVQDGPAQ